MAITGVFGADFSSFNQAVADADVRLKAFEDNSSKVERALTRMGDSFTGVKVVQEATLMAEAIDRVGGVSTLTARELERVSATAGEAVAKLTAMGQDVPANLRKLADETTNAKNSWSTFVGGLNIEQAIKNPLDTAKGAVVAFTSELGPMGAAIGGTVGLLGALGAALFKVTSDAAAVGANLDDMADKTGMSVPALSRLQNAATVAGSDLGTLTNAVFKLEQKMGEGGAAFEAALTKMGLSSAELKAVGVDHYLDTVAAGLASIEDPAERAAAGTAVLGKSYKDVAAVLADLPTAMQYVTDITPWTADQAKDAEKFEQQMQSAKVHVEALATSVGRELIPAFNGLIALGGPIAGWVAGVVANFTGLPQWFDHLKDGIGWVGAAWDSARGNLQQPLDLNTADAEARLKALKDATYDAAHSPDRLVEGWKAAAAGMTPHLATVDEVLAMTGKVTRDLDRDTLASIETGKKFAAAMTELESAGTGWYGTLQTIDGEVVAAVQYYLQAGVAQNALAEAYGLTAAQVKAVASSLKDQMDAEKLLDDFHKQTQTLDAERHAQDLKTLKEKNAEIIAGFNQIGKAQQDLDAMTSQSAMTGFDFKMQQVQQWAETSKACFRGTAEQYQQYADAIDAKALVMQQQLIDAENAHTGAVQTNTDRRVAAHDREYAAIDRIIGASRSLGDLSTANGSNTDPVVWAYMSQGYTANEALALARGGGGSNGILGAPERRSLSGGFDAVSGFGSISNVFNLTDTADGLARKVSDILTRDVYRGTKGAG